MNDEVAAAVRSLESSRSALADALVRPSSPRRHRAGFTASTASADGLWNALFANVAEAFGEHWQHGKLRASVDLARPVVADAVRRQPWTAVAVAALCGAVAVWIVSTRRRLIYSAARLWWRTAGTAILASAAFKLYEQYVGGVDRPAHPPDDVDETASTPAD